MQRREFLGAAGVAATIGLAGCAGGADAEANVEANAGDASTPTPTPTPKPKPEQTPEQHLTALVRAGLTADGAWSDGERGGSITEVEDGYQIHVQYDLKYLNGDGPAEARSNADWTAYYVAKSVFEGTNVAVDELMIQGFIPVRSSDGSVSDAPASLVAIKGSAVANVSWDEVGAVDMGNIASDYFFASRYFD